MSLKMNPGVSSCASGNWEGDASAEPGVAGGLLTHGRGMVGGAAKGAALGAAVGAIESASNSLLFSYRGSGGEASDGTVAVSSELSLPIEQQAAHVMGFDETHMSILSSAEVAAQLNAILGRASQ